MRRLSEIIYVKKALATMSDTQQNSLKTVLQKWHLSQLPVYSMSSRYSVCPLWSSFLPRKETTARSQFTAFFLVYWKCNPMLMEHETKRITYYWSKKSRILRWHQCLKTWATLKIPYSPRISINGGTIYTFTQAKSLRFILKFCFPFSHPDIQFQPISKCYL